MHLADTGCTPPPLSADEFVSRLKARLEAFAFAWRDARCDSPADYPERMSEADWLEFLLVNDILPAPRHLAPRPDLDGPTAQAA